MDEIDYKLNTNNSVLIVNAVEKLISLIKSKFKPAERQRFLLENQELKVLREKCSAGDQVVSHTACQGLLALVELGVLGIGHTMSTIVTLLPTAHNYSAIISTMAGLLVLDLKSRLVPGQPYQCQFSLKNPQHPFITVLEKNKAAEDDVLAQMHALCTHPEYLVSSNSLELLRPVFLWLTCNPEHRGNAQPWQLLLSLPSSTAQQTLLLSCLSCQQICHPDLVERSYAAYAAVADTALRSRDAAFVVALLPMLARISNELLKHGRDPRACYSLMDRCFSLELPELRTVAGLTLALLADNLPHTIALYLHPLFNLCLNITSKYKCSSISLNTFVAFSLQWLNMPSYLTTSALKVGAKLLDLYQTEENSDSRLDMLNLKNNKIVDALYYTDSRLSVMFKLNESWERIRDNPDKLKRWLNCIEGANGAMKLELVGFLIGMAMERRKEEWYEDVAIRALKIVVDSVEMKKELSVLLLPILLYKIGNDHSPAVRVECLRALPLMAKTKENVPSIVAILNKLKAGKGVPTSFLIAMYTTLAETQVRCFPYLQELLVETTMARPDELKWEIDVAKAAAVSRICELRPSSHGLELVPAISSLLNRCTDARGAGGSALALRALAALWRGAGVAPAGTWRAIAPKLGKEQRPAVQISICKLLGEVPALRVETADYDWLMSDAARSLWRYVADSNQPHVAVQACKALASYRLNDYKLIDIPQVYRNAVKLPASFCKTPADAARKPEDVLDYVPCEVWPDVFKFTNQDALEGVEFLTTKLIDREIRGYRSGVYQRDAPAPPQNMAYLPHTSVLRGLMDCFKKQVTSPSYDFSEAVLLSILRVLSAEYYRPLPPVELWFLQELFHRGEQWKRGCLQLAAGQATSSPHAKSFLDNYLLGIEESSEESDILLMFEILPFFCRGMPPNSLRGPLEKCLSAARHSCADLKIKDLVIGEEPLFVKQLEMIKKCLDSEKIDDANRTLLSQIMEAHFEILSDDNIAWPTYVRTCCSLPPDYLERMSYPSSWWEVTLPSLRKATSLLSAAGECGRWLDELAQKQAGHPNGHEYFLECIMPALQALKPDDEKTVEWFFKLMAITQVGFKETEDLSAHLYLCDLFMLSVYVFSGYCALDTEQQLNRGTVRALLPHAAGALLPRQSWKPRTLQVLEWLSHSRSIADARASAACQRALVALRHVEHEAARKAWPRLCLENQFGKFTNVED